MRVLVYEHVTAVGGPPALHRLGRLMRDALADDFRRLPGTTVDVFADGDAPVTEAQFVAAATAADRVVVIAPPFGGTLARLSALVDAAGGRRIGPTVEAIELTSDKLRLAEHWRDHGIQTPATTDRDPTPCELFPVVWKPRDGAGSVGTFRLDTPTDVPRVRAVRDAEGHLGPMVLQECVPGRPASVAFLTGPGVVLPLAPTWQHLSADGRFRYEGGELPIAPGLAERAVRTGRAAVGCVPGLCGFVGVDLVLGDAADGSGDNAIELNPRLSTSYVGLRALAETNLAGAMLRAAGGEVVRVGWKSGRVRFDAAGGVTAYRA